MLGEGEQGEFYIMVYRAGAQVSQHGDSGQGLTVQCLFLYSAYQVLVVIPN